jgi:hypothetical protein
VRILIALAPLVPLLVAAQAPTGAGRTPWTASRTPDGQPDLQGFWTNTTYTPLERPKNVTAEFYTEAEAVDMVKRAADVEAAQTEPGTIPDVHYDFTQFGLDRSQGPIALNLRTSLIVDPREDASDDRSGTEESDRRHGSQKAIG